MALSVLTELSASSLALLAVFAVFSALALRIVYNLYLHPLAGFHGPWYAASFSIVSALVSILRFEHEWLLSLAKRYGTDKPIRIAPTLLFFPQPEALKDIYWDPKCNNKSPFYGSGALGPPQLFSTLDGNVHKALRKALAGPAWTIGGLKNNWEPRIDEHIKLFVQRMSEFASRNEPVILSDKVAEFAADIMTLVCFTDPWGFVSNSRDERNMLESWRKGLTFFGFAGRFRFFRDVVLKTSWGCRYLLPSTSDDVGMGYLMAQADREVSGREQRIRDEEFAQEKPDYLQLCLEARMDGEPLTPVQKRAHITLLIQAGADTTGTALGSTLRFLLTHPSALARAREELASVDAAGKLTPSAVQFEETRAHLPFITACLKESLRLHPPATNLFARLAPAVSMSPKHDGGGKVIDGTWVPAGAEVTSHAYVVQRDPRLYGPEPEAFRPERWLEGEGNSKERISEMEACMFVFGIGPRVCLGKDVATMEMYKLVPEILRRFDFEVKREGKFVVDGGIAYNQDFEVQLRVREKQVE
ncbi:cytochrome P450 monooxygenase [Colletotrichum sojae]|uniref:Cytochrome P450 monooxygenase n=1 Tax=Colletotrichum sojae TaxID=2175907 RepID=A0A8H6IXR6_9PEZI|nr:cytochrome P450 monooxygenase [Colletotrichum sojae]